MFEYQGWATIRSLEKDIDEEQSLVESLSSKISEISHIQRVLELRYINGIPRVWTIGNTNRKGNDWAEVFELFNFIAAKSSLSYGVLSCWDDEDSFGESDSFQVFALRRGMLTKNTDTVLSPCEQKLGS